MKVATTDPPLDAYLKADQERKVRASELAQLGDEQLRQLACDICERMTRDELLVFVNRP